MIWALFDYGPHESGVVWRYWRLFIGQRFGHDPLPVVGWISPRKAPKALSAVWSQVAGSSVLLAIHTATVMAGCCGTVFESDRAFGRFAGKSGEAFVWP